MQSSPARHRQVFRNPVSAVAVVAIGAVVAVVVFVAVPDSAVSVVAVAAIAGMTLRAALAAVIASDDALVVRNPWRTHRLKWRDIQGFEVGDSARYPGTPLARANGRAVVLWAVRDIGNILRDEPARVCRVIDDLNRLLERHENRAAHPRPTDA